MLIYLSCPPNKSPAVFFKRPICIPLASGSFGDLVSASGEGQSCIPAPPPHRPGAWILAEALFLLERCGWEAERNLGSWENSVSGLAPPGLWRGGPVPNTGEGAGEFGRSGHRGQQCPEDLCHRCVQRCQGQLLADV